MKLPHPKNPLPKFGAPKINPGTGRLHSMGSMKGSKMLPMRSALNQLSKGNPEQQSINNYAKLTPSGAGAPMTYQSIIDMGMNAPDVSGNDETS
jgi:hypothetical protein